MTPDSLDVGVVHAKPATMRDLLDDLVPSAGLRNVPVHEYASIDLARVAESLGDAGAGYRRYVAEVAQALRARQGDEPRA